MLEARLGLVGLEVVVVVAAVVVIFSLARFSLERSVVGFGDGFSHVLVFVFLRKPGLHLQVQVAFGPHLAPSASRQATSSFRQGIPPLTQSLSRLKSGKQDSPWRYCVSGHEQTPLTQGVQGDLQRTLISCSRLEPKLSQRSPNPEASQWVSSRGCPLAHWQRC